MANPKCVTCDVDNARGKLLKCMHCVCVQCLPQHITFESKVCCPRCQDLTPSPPSGVTHMQALPDSAVLNRGAAGDPYKAETGESDSKFCDECMEDEKAVATCRECQLNYCQTHADSHPRSRATYKHRMETLGASAETPALTCEPQGHENCPFHPTQVWRSFCSQCCQLLCQQCEVIHPTEHKPCVSSLSNAASQARTALHAIFGGDPDKNVDTLDQAFTSVRRAIQHVHDETEKVSGEINKYFDGLVEFIRSREEKVLSDLDQLRTDKLLPLEAQRCCLGDAMAVSSTAKLYLKSAQPNANFLKMSPWLKVVALREEKVLSDHADLGTPANFVFSPNDVSLTGAVSVLGVVTEVAVLESNVASHYISASKASAARAILTGNLPNPSVSASKASAARASKEENLPNPSVSTSEVVLATHCISPEELSRPPVHRLCPWKSHPGAWVTNNNKTAIVVACYDKNVCVLGNTVHTTGQHDIRIRLDELQLSNIAIGMVENTELLPKEFSKPEFSGWIGTNQGQYTSSGKREFFGDVGQPWKDGDILHLHLNCKKRTLTARHDRTGKNHTIINVKRGQRLLVGFTAQHQQITII